MTDAERAVCDCSDPCVRQPCQVKTACVRKTCVRQTACVRQDRLRPARPLASGKTACVRKVMTPMARRSPALFELLEAWVLEDNEKWSGWDMRAMSARRFRPLS